MKNADLQYLKDALGFEAKAEDWPDADSLPLFLRAGAETLLVETKGTSFLLARPAEDATLPEIKRLHAQLSTRAGIPVAISVPNANARQRKALVSQGVPFVCAGRQAALPFLGAASTEWGKKKLEAKHQKKLTPKAQQAAIWGALGDGSYSLLELREATGMSESQASSAVGELVGKGMAKRSKDGRSLVITPIGEVELLDDHMGRLSSPLLRTIHVRKTPLAESLPDAGESALAARGALNPPSIPQKAASRAAARELEKYEVLEGELPDSETIQIQVWRYGPLFTGTERIDNISLALSLADLDDERIDGEIRSLFGRELDWREAL